MLGIISTTLSAARDYRIVAATCADCGFLDVAVVDKVVAVAYINPVVVAFFLSLVAFADLNGVIAVASRDCLITARRAVNRNGVVTVARVD